jgi:hypothetical protein
VTSVLDEILARFEALPKSEQDALVKTAIAATPEKWWPSPGPQTEAYFSSADVLLYGGQGGGGKTDLGLGLAFTRHQRSLILRRKYANLGSITERAIEINGSRNGFNGSPPPLLRTADGRYIQFAGNQHLGDEQDWQGQPFDLKVFDEACQFLAAQIQFHIGWLRSTTDGQRVRAVLATNPPVNSDGDWIIGMFRPWLDVTHPKPAKHGELRWYVTAPDGSDLEVDGPEPIVLPGAAEPVVPMSRSFIPAALRDNPFLIDTGYQAKLDGLPEPLRSAVRDGNFMAARQDASNQVIPTAWVIEAQSRWQPDGYKTLAMTAMAMDMAGGGHDTQELAMRYGGWYAPLVSRKGEETKDGAAAAGVIFAHRRDSCPVIIDVGGGFGGAVSLRLKDNGVEAVAFNASGAAAGVARDGSNRVFLNKRAEAWWRFREALDPDQEGGSVIALPPDPELRSDLTSPTYKPDMLKIQIESKDDIRKRILRSTNKADAVVMCLSSGDAAVKRLERKRGPMRSTANVGHSKIKERLRGH